MDSSRILWIIVLIVLIIVSALCSASETALSSANMIRIKSYVKKNRKNARKVYNLIKNYSETITTILIFNNIVNTASASIATYLISSIYGSNGILYATVLMTFFILLFGEITPKIFAKRFAEDISLRLSPVLCMLVFVTKPITYLVLKFEKLLKGKSVNYTATEEELLEIVQLIEHEGVLEQDESELIQNAATFDEKFIKDVMIDKNDVVFVYDDISESDLKKLIIEKKYTRIPVVSRRNEKVIGVIYEGDLIDSYLTNGKIEVKNIVKDVMFLTKDKKLSYALEKIQKSRRHIAIVVDSVEERNFLGIITLEDILEELVGEIYDEYDDLPKNVYKIGLHTYRVEANIEVESFFNKYLKGVRLPEIESKTFAGWLKEKGNVSVDGVMKYENISIKVLEVNNDNPSKLEIVVSSNYKEV